MVADSLVGAHAAGDVADVRAHPRAQFGHRVDERQLDGQKRVAGIFGQLGAFQAHPQNSLVSAEGGHPLGGLIPIGDGTDHHPLGMAEVVDGMAFSQELRIHHRMDAASSQHLAEPTRGTHRHSRFHGDHRVGPQALRQFAYRVLDRFQIGAAAVVGRCRNADEHDITISQSTAVTGEAQCAELDTAAQ